MHWFWRIIITIAISSVLIAVTGSLARHTGSLARVDQEIPEIAALLSILFVPLGAYAVVSHITNRSTRLRLPDETRCRKCGYILRGLTEPRCPECGERI